MTLTAEMISRINNPTAFAQVTLACQRDANYFLLDSGTITFCQTYLLSRVLQRGLEIGHTLNIQLQNHSTPDLDLPSGCRWHQTEKGEVFFINDLSRTTSWTHPRVEQQLVQEKVSSFSYHFFNVYSWSKILTGDKISASSVE